MKKLQRNLLIVTGIIFVISSVFLTIESVTSGAEISSLRLQEENLLAKKSDLAQVLVKSISVSELQTQSESLGFIKPTNLIYVEEGQGVASKN